MLNQKYAEASVEVLDILEHMNAKELAKVSQKFINFLKENASKEYISNLDYSKKLNDMELKEETRGLLALMYKSYWCPEEEKQNLQAKFKANEQKFQEESREKYNPDNVFKNRHKYTEEEVENTKVQSIQLVEYEGPKWYQRLFARILRIFKK